jgi:cytochrome c biogenesis protein CcdA
MAKAQQLLWLLFVVALLGWGRAANTVPVYYFWGDGCPVCARQDIFLRDLKERFPEVEVRSFEVWFDADNQVLFRAMASAYGTEARAVPTTFVSDNVWVGFNAAIGEDIIRRVEFCREFDCPDPADRLPAEWAERLGRAPPADEPLAIAPPAPGPTVSEVLTIPLLGQINLADQSLVVMTSLIAFIDGFNPCSLWVLSMLLAMVINSGAQKRRKVLVVGLTFLTVATLVYGLFMIGLVNVFAYVGFLGWIQAAVAFLALAFAAINIKDYFFFKEGVSLTISDQHKPGIFRGMRRIMQSDRSLFATMGATAALALGVTLVELPCTAGFPMIWSAIVARHEVGLQGFLLLLGLYLLIFLLDELFVFGTVVVTLKASRFEESHGRVLKLIGGMIMLALALMLLIEPELMNSLVGSVGVFAAALLASVLILLVHRKLLPRWGLAVGNEAALRSPRR